MTVHHLTPPPGSTLPEALAWFDRNARRLRLPLMAPPIDRLGTESGDSWLAQVFEALTQPGMSNLLRVRHLQYKAADAQRIADHSREMAGSFGHHADAVLAAAEDYAAVARTLRKWVEDLNAAPVVVEMGGSAA